MSTWTRRDRSAASIFTGWAQRVNGSYSLFNTENFWTLWGSVSDCSAFCCRAEFCPLHQPAEERQTDKEESRCFWGFTVAMDTLSSLLNTCFCWHHRPGWSTQSRRSSSVPGMNPETGADVCRLRRILISDNDDWEFQRQKKRRSSSLMWILWAARAPPQTQGVILVPCDAAC